MPTIEELVVKAKPAGLDETSEGFNQMEEDLDAAGEEMASTTEQMEGLQSRWMGAMGAIVAGLGVAAAGLLSQVPVLGEAMGGLGAIVEALAYQMDQVLRPVVTPLTNTFYEWSAAIFEADGATGDFIGVVTTLTALLIGLVSIVFSAGFAFGALGFGGGGVAAVTTVFSTLVGWLSTAVSVIAGVVSGSLTLAATLGALVGLLGVTILEVTGVLDWFQTLGRYVGNVLPQEVTDGLMLLLSPFALLGSVINGFVQGVLDGGLSEGFDRALQNGQRMLDQLGKAWERHIKAWRGLVNDFISWLGGAFDGPVISSAIDMVTGGGGSGGGGGGFRAQRSGSSNIYLDGRRLTEDTGRYRSDQTTRRGRGP